MRPAPGAGRRRLPAAPRRAHRLRADRGPGLPAGQRPAARRRFARAHRRGRAPDRADPARDAGGRERRGHRRAQLHLRRQRARTSPRSSRAWRRGRRARAPSSRPTRSWRASRAARLDPGGGRCVVFPPPPIRGISSGGGFQFELQSVAGGSLSDLDGRPRGRSWTRPASGPSWRPRSRRSGPACRSSTPRSTARKAKALGVPLVRCLRDPADLPRLALRERLQRLRPRVPRAAAGRAELPRRAERRRATLRARPGRREWHSAQMVPLSTLVTVRPITGPDTIAHYNLYRSAEIAGDTAPGASSGQAIAAMEDLARRLPPGMAYEWTGLAYQEIEAGKPRGVRVRAVRAVRLPGAGRPVRELARAPGGDPGRAARRARRAERAVARRARQRRLRADRPGPAHRSGQQERDPDRGVRQGAARARRRDPRGRARGGPRFASARS